MRAPRPGEAPARRLVCLAAACGGPGTTPAAALKASVDELERLDTAWTALDQRIEQTCG